MPQSHWPRQLFEALRDALFPLRCMQCGALYRQRKAMSSNDAPWDRIVKRCLSDALCDACACIDRITSPMCPICGLPFATSHGLDHPCPDCRSQRFRFDSAQAVGRYEGALKLLLANFKYRGVTQLAKPLAWLMWTVLELEHDLDRFDCLIPVPLHWRRKRQRGFNQAELLVRQWPCLARGLTAERVRAKLALTVLGRSRATKPQAGLASMARSENLRGAFAVKKPQCIQGASVLLVDDVLTTGATADACAQALKRAGAASVHVGTIARAV